jgi:hypothetical protein
MTIDYLHRCPDLSPLRKQGSRPASMDSRFHGNDRLVGRASVVSAYGTPYGVAHAVLISVRAVNLLVTISVIIFSYPGRMPRVLCGGWSPIRSDTAPDHVWSTVPSVRQAAGTG